MLAIAVVLDYVSSSQLHNEPVIPVFQSKTGKNIC